MRWTGRRPRSPGSRTARAPYRGPNGRPLPHIVTQKQIADALDWSPSKVTRIENGSISLSVTDLRALLAYYGVTGPQVVEGLVDLARRSRRARSPFAAFGDVFPP